MPQPQSQTQVAIKPFRSTALDTMREKKISAMRAARRPNHCRNAGDLMYPESVDIELEEDFVEDMIVQAQASVVQSNLGFLPPTPADLEL